MFFPHLVTILAHSIANFTEEEAARNGKLSGLESVRRWLRHHNSIQIRKSNRANRKYLFIWTHSIL